ncbi:unnamed protein product [Lactuca saligna]|uniref:Protein kinase domain-containing protein n=1 Tax=Lactuca saligna TaxID=75948 RepID=A0AA35V659_LACSI|nr:unnamed protein product [Lactuca saligna]
MVGNKMQQFQVLHFLILILLTTFTKAQNYIQTRCERSCGQANIIRFPFGIGINCSLNEWFNIECNSQRAYLPALNNVEVLNAYYTHLILNVPMISDCKNSLHNSSLDLSRSPFRYSRYNNMLVFQGCGHADIIMENGTIVGGCSTTCRKDSTVSDLNNCFGVGCCQTTIAHDLRWFTLNRTSLESQDGDGTLCGSAFLMYKYRQPTFGPQSIGQDHSFVPVSLSLKGNDTSVGCNNMCGNVSIRYPFGIGRSCSGNEWFTIDCNSSTPYLSALNNLELLDIKSERFTVNVPMISDCENPIQNSSLDLNRSPFYFSKNGNLFVVEGCGNGVIINENGDISGGCSTSCGNESVSERNNCFGIGCCETTMTYDLKSFTLNLTELVGSHAGNVSCSRSAFLVDKNSYMKGRFSSQSTVEDQRFVPVSLEWGYMDEGGNTKEDKKCIDCEFKGGHCYYKDGLDSDVTCLYDNKISLGVILGVSISIGLLLLIVMGYALYKIIKKTKAKRRKQRFFKRNGGILLRQQQTTDISLVDKTILFTSNELDKATHNFNENRILGRGGQGTVYKGMLADGRIIAIKKSKVVDESQLEQFINEVVILSQVSHRNVVKLLGCCLETEVPLLVSEFISNEVAGALSYLHSATSIPIYHRDIKTTNILLDEKYRAKVSDFGTSRLVSIDQTHLTTLVKGTFGYLDPEYFQSSQFTEKSDKFSFTLHVSHGRRPAMSIFDASVVKEGSRSELLAIANLAMQCLNFNGRNRPTMKEVASELEGIRLSHVPLQMNLILDSEAL